MPLIREACASGALGCVACKTELAETLNAYLRPARERRAAIDRAPGRRRSCATAASARARSPTQTLRDVRRVLRLSDV